MGDTHYGISSNFTVEKVYPKESKYSCLMSFENGYITEDFKTVNQSTCLQDTNTDLKTVVATINDILYEGNEIKEELGMTFIVIRNRKTGKSKFVQVGRVAMKARLQNNFTNAKVQLNESNALELSRKFGSKKQKKQIEHREKLKKVNLSTVSVQLEKVIETAANVSLQDLSIYTKSDSDNLYLPPINRDATNANEVYKADNLLGPDLVAKICSEVDDDDFTEILCPYLKNMITPRKHLNDTEKALVLYANALIKLYLEPYKELIKKTYKVSISPTVNQLVLSNFTSVVKNRRMRPNSMKDKAICHLIVILLLLNDLKFQLDLFAAAVKITPSTAIAKVKVVGAYVVNTSGIKIAQLKIPLNTVKTFARRKSVMF